MSPTTIPYFKAWLVFIVASVLLSMGVGAAAGFVVGMVMGIAGVDVSLIRVVGSALGFVIGLIVSFIMFRWVIDRYILPAAISSQASMT